MSCWAAWPTQPSERSVDSGSAEESQRVRYCLFSRKSQVCQSHWIEVIIRERDEAESSPPKIYDLVDDTFEGPLPRLPVHRCATQNRMNNASGIHELFAPKPTYTYRSSSGPSGQREIGLLRAFRLRRYDSRSLPEDPTRPCPTPHRHLLEDNIRPPALRGLFGKQGRVNAAIDNVGSPFMGEPSNLIPVQGVSCMHA